MSGPETVESADAEVGPGRGENGEFDFRIPIFEFTRPPSPPARSRPGTMIRQSREISTARVGRGEQDPGVRRAVLTPIAIRRWLPTRRQTGELRLSDFSRGSSRGAEMAGGERAGERAGERGTRSERAPNEHRHRPACEGRGRARLLPPLQQQPDYEADKTDRPTAHRGRSHVASRTCGTSQTDTKSKRGEEKGGEGGRGKRVQFVSGSMDPTTGHGLVMVMQQGEAEAALTLVPCGVEYIGCKTGAEDEKAQEGEENNRREKITTTALSSPRALWMRGTRRREVVVPEGGSCICTSFLLSSSSLRMLVARARAGARVSRQRARDDWTQPDEVGDGNPRPLGPLSVKSPFSSRTQKTPDRAPALSRPIPLYSMPCHAVHPQPPPHAMPASGTENEARRAQSRLLGIGDAGSEARGVLGTRTGAPGSAQCILISTINVTITVTVPVPVPVPVTPYTARRSRDACRFLVRNGVPVVSSCCHPVQCQCIPWVESSRETSPLGGKIRLECFPVPVHGPSVTKRVVQPRTKKSGHVHHSPASGTTYTIASHPSLASTLSGAEALRRKKNTVRSTSYRATSSSSPDTPQPSLPPRARESHIKTPPGASALRTAASEKRPRHAPRSRERCSMRPRGVLMEIRLRGRPDVPGGERPVPDATSSPSPDQREKVRTSAALPRTGAGSQSSWHVGTVKQGRERLRGIRLASSPGG
ncbi:unnamed protein product [Diplocarpon coronariae]